MGPDPSFRQADERPAANVFGYQACFLLHFPFQFTVGHFDLNLTAAGNLASKLFKCVDNGFFGGSPRDRLQLRYETPCCQLNVFKLVHRRRSLNKVKSRARI
jgi:hypothetical protein